MSHVVPNRALVLAAALLAVAAIPPKPAAAKDIAVTPDQIERLQIALEQVRPAANEAVALLPATVVPAPNARVTATAPFGGTVVQVHALPGQHVAKGDPLATVASRELLEAQGALSQAEAELQSATAIAERKRTLADKRIMSATLADEAEAQVAKIRAVIAQHKAMMAIGGIGLGDGGTYTIRAPAAGVVADTDAMTGEPIAAMAPAVSIDTSNELWLEVQAPATLVSRIHTGDLVQVVDGPQGKVVSVGNNIEKITRSVRMLAALPENSGLLPGQMVTIAIMRRAETGGLQVPASAVAWIGGSHAVFTRNADGFSLKPVTLEGRTMDVATIKGDLASGDVVAASGLPQLETILGGN